MNGVRFRCSPADVYSVFDLRDWLERERLAGRAAGGQRVSIEVVHPDREMDGSCRWCGCRQDEVVDVSPAGG